MKSISFTFTFIYLLTMGNLIDFSSFYLKVLDNLRGLRLFYHIESENFLATPQGNFNITSNVEQEHNKVLFT